MEKHHRKVSGLFFVIVTKISIDPRKYSVPRRFIPCLEKTCMKVEILNSVKNMGRNVSTAWSKDSTSVKLIVFSGRSEQVRVLGSERDNWIVFRYKAHGRPKKFLGMRPDFSPSCIPTSKKKDSAFVESQAKLNRSIFQQCFI
ncbi:hypothetical protein SAMN04488515_3235 [Cognatiyoonia koreensis]|uniref:Uncharacterized protein n=1 Tax=Cognatiyoonia koreensis TaxID=364200 RepID=A0A1I0RTT9_9RHOB|nr:hypothetical protein SAMN04488515_3235 [Cognatiyoonia koreensis]